MPADVETMVSVREVPWHGLGEIVEDKLTAREALLKAGLDWKVNLLPALVDPQAKQSPDGSWNIDPTRAVEVGGRYHVIRDKDFKVLGAVGSSYVPLQNEDAFTFFDAIVDDGEAKYETAGSLNGGKRVFITAKVPDGITIAGEDPVDLYILLTNDHTGGRSVQAAVTPVRVVCTNTCNYALQTAEQAWSIRHVSDVTQRVLEARQALELSFTYITEFQKTADTLATTKMSERQLTTFTRRWAEDTFAWSDKVVEDAQERVKALFFDGPNQENIRGTKWAALQSVGEYLEWERPRTDESRLKLTLFAGARTARNRALAMLV